MNRKLKGMDNQGPFEGRCVVCSKKVRVDEQHLEVYLDGRYYLVCCASCAGKLEEEPRRFLSMGSDAW